MGRDVVVKTVIDFDIDVVVEVIDDVAAVECVLDVMLLDVVADDEEVLFVLDDDENDEIERL